MSTASHSVLPLSLPGATSRRLSNGLNIAQGRPSLGKRENLRTQDKSYRNATTIDMLIDNVLVEIFDFCRLGEEEAHIQLEYSSRTVWKWHLLVHVCRRWRQIIFASPRRLHLEIFCTDGTPVRSNLGVWPAIPIVIQYGLQDVISVRHYDEDNVIAALEHPDRVCHVGLQITRSQLGRIVTVMQEPFPVLRCLSISSEDEDVPDIPSGFLAGSAPCLQEIKLSGVPFPSLPTLLLSASDLVELNLCNIPETGYISPEVMVATLSTLPKLKILEIGLSPDPPPDQLLLPPITRTVLPVLNALDLSGVYESVEDFLARIDTPQLNAIEILYSDQVVDFEVPQLSDFINRSENLKRTLSRHCQIMVEGSSIDFCIGGATAGDEDEPWDHDTGIYVCLLCRWMVRQILH
ncbi:hypothetical protein EDB89DRAFT_1368376 [Lactarius sanguifluus]|nr:hypothetical protein EDB89DRAFT_1368376 [Lactarius sanguifluus]